VAGRVSGVGHVIDAMTAMDFDARLTQSPFGWRASFCRLEVRPLPKWEGLGVDRTPWRAVQSAALDTLIRTEGT
jgi:hypothetical protein